MRRAILLMILMAGFFSCHKEKLNSGNQQAFTPPTDVCPDTGYKARWGVEVDYHFRFSYTSPTPNPLDNDEFAYVYGDSVQMGDSMYPHYQLRVYNLRTGENRELIHDMNLDASGNMSWSIKGWIVFNTAWGELYKIKSDGTGLTRLGNLHGYHPSWSPNGDKFQAGTYAGSDGGFIADENGNILIKNDFWGSQAQWADEDNYLLTVSAPQKGYGLGLYNIHTKQQTWKYAIPKENFNYEDYQWINDHTVVWVPEGRSDHLYVRDLNTSATTILRNTCPAYSYTKITLGPDKKYIYCIRGYLYTYPDGMNGIGTSEIVRIELSTGKLQHMKLEL